MNSIEEVSRNELRGEPKHRALIQLLPLVAWMFLLGLATSESGAAEDNLTDALNANGDSLQLARDGDAAITTEPRRDPDNILLRHDNSLSNLLRGNANASDFRTDAYDGQSLDRLNNNFTAFPDFSGALVVVGDKAALKIGGFIKADFFGGEDGGNGSLRLRHAYGTIGRFTAGQTWTTFTDPSAVPQTLDFEGAVSNVNRRQGLVRFNLPLGDSGLYWAIAIEEPTVRGQSLTNLSRTDYVAANLIYNPYDRVFCGMEYLYGVRENQDGRRADANRIQMSFGFYLP